MTPHMPRTTPTELQEALVRRRAESIPLGTSAQIVSNVKRIYDLTQSHLAELLGVDQSYVSRVERGQRKLTLAHLETLARCARLPAAVFLWKVLGPPPTVSARKKRLLARAEALLRKAFPDSWEGTPVPKEDAPQPSVSSVRTPRVRKPSHRTRASLRPPLRSKLAC